MKKGVKKRVRSKKGFIILLIVVIAVVVAGVLTWLLWEKNCMNDSLCFDKAFSKCARARYDYVKGGNLYEYKTKGVPIGECVMEVELVRMAAGSDAVLVERFEGKKMKCRIPESVFRGRGFSQVDNVMDYCSGELKEEVYELIIERMYSYLISNLDVLEEEFEAGLEVVER
jgi:hypothetical protein